MRKIALVILSLCFALTAATAQDIFMLSRTGSPRQIEAAIAAGAKVNSIEKTDQGGISPLMYALRNKDPQVLAVLIREGVDPGFLQRIGNLVWSAPLIQAAANENPEYVRLLLAAGAPVDDRNGLDRPPLMLAAQANPEPEILAALLDGGCELEAIDKLGRSALIIAAGKSQNPKVLGALLNAGAKTRLVDRTMRTAQSHQLATLAAASK